MATNVLLPQWGMNMEDGTLVKWLVKEGDEVEKGQPLVEVETAKINSDLESYLRFLQISLLCCMGTSVSIELFAKGGLITLDPKFPISPETSISFFNR